MGSWFFWGVGASPNDASFHQRAPPTRQARPASTHQPPVRGKSSWAAMTANFCMAVLLVVGQQPVEGMDPLHQGTPALLSYMAEQLDRVRGFV